MALIETLDFQNLTFEQVRVLEKVILDMQDNYIHMISEISEKQTLGQFWWFTTIASRNVNFSPLFMKCAYISLIAHYFKSGYQISHIHCEDKHTAKAIEEFLKNSNISTEVTYERVSFKKKLNKSVQIFRNVIYTLAMAYCTIRFQKRLRVVSNHELFLVDMFVVNGTVTDSGYKERYFNGLTDYLSEEEKESLYLFPTHMFSAKKFISKFKLLGKVSGVNFLSDILFLKLSDYVDCWKILLHVSKCKHSATLFNGFNIAELLDCEVKSELISFILYLACLRYKAIERMQEKGVKVKGLLDWHEGQPLDKATYSAFRKCYPNVEIIAYNGLVSDIPYYNYIIPTVCERINGLTPHKIAVMGEAMVPVMTRYDNQTKVMLAPAFRHSHVWAESTGIGKNVVVVLSLVPQIKKQIIDILLKALASPFFLELIGDSKIFIRKHPVDNENLLDLFNSYPMVEWSDGPASKMLDNCGVMVCCQSMACLEAVSMGIPTIVIGNTDTITINSIPETVSGDIWRLCYNDKELISALEHFLNLTPQEKINLEAIGEQCRKSFFEKCTRESVRRLLGYLSDDMNT